MEKLKQTLSKAVSKTKNYYQHVLSAVMMILLILIVYGRDLMILANEALQTEALSHILLIPFFVGFLFYLKKDMVKASLALEKYQKQTKTKHIDELIGVSLCLIAFLLYWYGSYTFHPLEYHLLSLPIFVMGIILILFNLKTLKVLILPILFLFFLIPPPNEIMYAAGGTLANFNTEASYNLLKTFGLPVTLSSAYGSPTLMLITSAGEPASFRIDLPCSGVYTLIAFVMFATFLVFVSSTSFLKKAGVFTLGFAIFGLLNIVRITTIISIAYWFGEEVAMFIFHTFAGLVLIFAGMLLTLFAAEKFLKTQIFPSPQEPASCSKCEKSRKTYENFCLQCGKFFNPFKKKISQRFWTKLFLLLIGCSVATLSINAPTFAIAQDLKVESGWEYSTDIFPQIPGYAFRFFWRDTEFERIAKQDASLTYAYIPDNKSDPVVYVLVGVANSISNLHSWEVCLITWQTAHGQYPIVSVLDSRDMLLLEDIPLIARYLVFTYQSPQNHTQVTLYWYTRATFKTGPSVEQKYVRISLIILTKNASNYRQFENKLFSFGQTIADYWKPLQSQSLVSLGIPAQQLLLVSSIAFVIIAKTTQYSAEWRKKKNNLGIFGKFAPEEEKMLFQIILDIAKEKKSIETREISAALKAKTSRNLAFDALLNRLNRLEEYGFIKKDVTTVKNRPKLIWKVK